MKKFRLVLFGIILCALCLMPQMFVSASVSEVDTYYPSGIEDYVDLNNISCFEISGNKIFYATSNNEVFEYDKTTRKTLKLNTGTTSTVKNINVAGEYVVVFAGNNSFAFNLNDTSKNADVCTISSFNDAIVKYVNNKYYYIYTTANAGSSVELNVEIYNDLTKNQKTTKKFSNLEYVDGAQKYLLAMNENFIIAVTTSRDKMYVFETSQLSSTETTLTPLNNANAEKNNFDLITAATSDTIINTKSVDIYNNHMFACFDIGENSSKTKMIIEATIDSESGTAATISRDNLSGGENLIDFMIVKDGNFYGYSKTNCDITQFSYGNPMVKIKAIIAGKGNNIGRFKGVTSVTYKANTLYVTDSGNSRTQDVSTTAVHEQVYPSGYSCSEVVVDKNNQTYLVLFNSQNSFLYKNYRNGVTPIATVNNEQVVSVDINIDGSIFMLTENNIYLYKNNTTAVSQSISLANNNSKIRVGIAYPTISPTNINSVKTVSALAAAANLYVSSNNTIYKISTQSGNISDVHMTYDSNIVDFRITTSGKVVALLENGNIVSSNWGDTSESETYKTLSGFTSHKCFDIDPVSGYIYIYNDNRSAFEIIKDENFVDAGNFGTYYDTNNASLSAGVWKYGTFQIGTLIYDHPYYIGNYTKITASGLNCIVISTPVKTNTSGEIEYGEFTLVGYFDNGVLKTGYIETSKFANGIQTIGITNTEYTLRSTNKNVSVYKYPTICPINSKANNVVYATLNQGETITTIGRYPIKLDENSTNDFYIVTYKNAGGSVTGYGYIYSTDVVKNSNISKTIKTNAKINIFDNSKTVTVYTQPDETSGVVTYLTHDYKVNAIDYNKQNPFTKITFLDADGQEREGYISTKYIKLNGLSRNMIIAIVLIAVDAVIAVVVIVFFNIYRKKQKAEAEKENLEHNSIDAEIKQQPKSVKTKEKQTKKQIDTDKNNNDTDN